MAKPSLLEAFVQGSHCLAHVLEAKPSLLDGEAIAAWRTCGGTKLHVLAALFHGRRPKAPENARERPKP
eukprot:10868778-Alexandrium_andersonii.AAC.1